MTARTLHWLPVLALVASAAAQLPPQPGRDWYEETARHGFRIKAPKGWDYFPDERGSPNVLGRYVPKRADVLELEGDAAFRPTVWLLAFLPPTPEEAAEPQRDTALAGRYDTLEEWILGNGRQLDVSFAIKGLALVEQEDVKIKDTQSARHVLWRGEPEEEADGEGLAVHLWATTYVLEPDHQVALLASAPSDKRDWGKWRSPLKRLARTFVRVELEAVDYSSVTGSGLRARRHRELLDRLQQGDGTWELHVTPNYFVISNSSDRDFVEDVKLRLEAIREQFEREFPREKALAALQRRLSAPADAGEGGDDGEQQGAGDQAGAQARTVVLEDPVELSRCSVVRVCDDRQDYHTYGGPSGSAGYWWSATEELVIYDDQEVGGRRNTWATLHHEAFHQFIHYFFGGSLRPGTWYNEGNADFYAGYELNSRKRYDMGRFDWRNTTIKREIQEERNVPLQTLVGLSKEEYYGRASVEDPRSGRIGTFSRYPHGWSFVYFLRSGKENRAKYWNDDWDGILDTYLDVLIETGDVEQATQRAFAGVDWDELERAWEQYIVKGR